MQSPSAKSLGTADAPLDLVVAGSGIAGLVAALTAAPDGRVAIVTKGDLLTSASFWAQGGVAAALADDDTPALHAADTHAAGRGLCRPSAVETLTVEAPARIADLVDLGTPFDEGLGLEGGHSHRRIVHAEGAETGAVISRTLAARVLADPRIQVIEHAQVVDLWVADGRCVGLVTADGPIGARATLLATGGYASLWDRTTNPPGSVGEGIVLAHRHGAAVADLEFAQFHPTALAKNGMLLSEALRGEGATLIGEDGRRFTDELAPRDVVARAIDSRAGGTALLDLRGIDRSRFPGLMARIGDAGYDPAREPIPVSPAAHYTLGGVVTDLEGRTELEGLFAAGECAATGVHGANRLASNSLLECLVFGRRAAIAALAEPGLPARLGTPAPSEALPLVTPAVRRAMWRDAGLVRDGASLERLLGAPHPLARLVAGAALTRAESRGGHFRADHPFEDPAYARHVVHRRGERPTLETWA